MKITKILSLILALSILTLSLSSCNKTPESLTEKADKVLTKRDHTIEVDIDYTVQDNTVSSIFEQLEAAEIKLVFDGDDFAVSNRMSIDYGEGATDFVSYYTVIGNTVYSDIKYTLADGSNSVKSRAALTDEARKEIFERGSVIGGIEISDFGSTVYKKIDGEHIITCTDASDELNAKLEKIIISQLEDAADSVRVKNARMVIEIDDGRYDTVKIICEYNVTLYSKTYTVGAEYELEYDYDDRARVEAPTNPLEYAETPIENILDTM